MKLSKTQREELRGRFDGRCAYCGCPLKDRWHADHLEAIERKFVPRVGGGFRPSGQVWKPENDRLDNLMPSCAPCNVSKATLTLEQWRTWLIGHVRALNAHNNPYRLAKAYGLIIETGNPVVFYFEKKAEGERGSL